MKRAVCVLFALALSACVNDGPQDGNSKPDLKEASRLNAALGADYLNKGQIDQAKEKLERAVEQDSDNAQAHASLALVYARQGETKGARRQYRNAL